MKITRRQLRRIIKEATISPLMQDAHDALDLMWEEYPNADVAKMSMELIESLIDEIEETGDVLVAQEFIQLLKDTLVKAQAAQQNLYNKDEFNWFMALIPSIRSAFTRLEQIR